MTLPSSGSISISEAAAEFGISLPCVFPDAFYGKPGMASSGPLILPDDFYGKSNVVFAPTGVYITNSGLSSASATITCSVDATWTYSGTLPGAKVSISRASGSTGPSITFTVLAPGGGGTLYGNWSLTGTAFGVTKNYTIELSAGDSLS